MLQFPRLSEFSYGGTVAPVIGFLTTCPMGFHCKERLQALIRASSRAEASEMPNGFPLQLGSPIKLGALRVNVLSTEPDSLYCMQSCCPLFTLAYVVFGLLYHLQETRTL